MGSVWLLSDTLAFQATSSFITGDWDDAGPGLKAGLLLGEEPGIGMHPSPSVPIGVISQSTAAGGDPVRCRARRTRTLTGHPRA